MNFIKTLYVGIQNKFNNVTFKFDRETDYTLKFDRILDADNQIYIGIGTRKQSEDSTKSLQVIRIGDYTKKYYRLINFEEKHNELKYEFENNIKLILKKRENIIENHTIPPICQACEEDRIFKEKFTGEFKEQSIRECRLSDTTSIVNGKAVTYQLELFNLNNNIFISNEIDPNIIKHYKKINLASNELDKIYNLFNSK